MQFQLVAPPYIAAKIEGPTIADQRAYLLIRVPIATIAASSLYDRVKLREILRITDVPRWRT